jgi:anthranilate synthase/aminodeoxychorismate synthase-like glutamine amidotransferase
MQKLAKIVVLDNNDSFTYNLVDLLRNVNGLEPIIVPWSSKEVIPEADAYILSPGPGLPMEKPLMKTLMDRFHQEKPILGICLGFQFIAQYFNMELRNLGEPLHGIEASVSKLKEDVIFNQVEFPFKAALYHSWALTVEPQNEEIDVLAEYENIPMAIKHKKFNIYGFQFHPESFLTEVGERLVSNWLIHQVQPFMTQ